MAFRLIMLLACPSLYYLRHIWNVDGGGGGGGSSGDFTTVEVKEVMNQTYQKLRGEFEDAESYGGSAVKTAILEVIKVQTLGLLKKTTEEENDEDDSDGDDSDGDDSDGDDSDGDDDDDSGKRQS